jgi:hypothetical protein
MGATRRNLQARPKILKKTVETSNLQIRTKIYLKKLCFVPQKCEGAKNRMEATRRNLQAQPKILKKIVGTSNQRIRTKIFSKNMFSTYLKSVKGQKFAGSTQNL